MLDVNSIEENQSLIIEKPFESLEDFLAIENFQLKHIVAR